MSHRFLVRFILSTHKGDTRSCLSLLAFLQRKKSSAFTNLAQRISVWSFRSEFRDVFTTVFRVFRFRMVASQADWVAVCHYILPLPEWHDTPTRLYPLPHA